MVNHGFATGALFLARRVPDRAGAARDTIADYGGVQKVAPVLAGLFLLAGLAGLSLPGLSTFVSRSSWCWSAPSPGTRSRASFAIAGIVLAAIYILWMYQRTMTGPDRRVGRRRCRDLQVAGTARGRCRWSR